MNNPFARRLSAIKSKLPSGDKIKDIVFSLFRELFLAVHIFLELIFNIFIVLCALEIFNSGIALYMLRNGGNVSKVLIELGSYLAFMIPAIVVRNIILKYI